MEIEMPLDNIIGLIIFLLVLISVLSVFIFSLLQKPKAKSIPSEKEFDNLAQMLQDRKFQEIALNRLSLLKDPRVFDLITSFIESLNTEDENDRRIMIVAFLSIANINNKNTKEYLISSIKEGDVYKKYGALKGIEYLIREKGMKDKDFINPLISFLNDLKELKMKNDKRFDQNYEKTAILLIEELTGRSFE
uniref:HEAT repeat domain-containing protein n=1 Tax=candidate division WOR-3 bacterium TaxID=2052148 RepID=A0A7C4U7F4_UNCW3